MISVLILFLWFFNMFHLTCFLPVPAQPSSFEAEAELDTRIKLTWLWPVQDPITKYELQYWEANSDNKVRILTRNDNFYELSFSATQHTNHTSGCCWICLIFSSETLDRIFLFMMEFLWLRGVNRGSFIVVTQSPPQLMRKIYCRHTLHSCSTLMWLFISIHFSLLDHCWKL